MKQQLNEIKKMQRIAGLITENEYQESLINEGLPITDPRVEEIIQMLKDLDVDGETMEYIIRAVGMDDQTANQLVHNKAELNEEQYAEPMIMIQNIVDNFFDGGIDADAAMTRIEKILQGNYEDESGEDSLDENYDSDKAVMYILNRNGIDDDYFESMGGLEIEMGGNEWMDTLSDLTGKDAYADEFDEEDDTKISNFMSAIKSLGIEFV